MNKVTSDTHADINPKKYQKFTQDYLGDMKT